VRQLPDHSSNLVHDQSKMVYYPTVFPNSPELPEDPLLRLSLNLETPILLRHDLYLAHFRNNINRAVRKFMSSIIEATVIYLILINTPLEMKIYSIFLFV